MARPADRTILFVALATFFLAVLLAALAGVRAAPDDDLHDWRRSVLLDGPRGASGLAGALETLGVAVEPRRRALFDVAADTAGPAGGTVIALLDVAQLPSDAEVRALVGHVRRGGDLFLTGWNGVEHCFGADITWLHEEDEDSMAVRSSLDLPATEAVVVEPDPEEDEDASEFLREQRQRRREACGGPASASAVDTLLRTVDRRSVAWRVRAAGGGTVILLADSRYVTNEALRETDAGLLVLPWLLELHPARVVVDEYHQGFGRGGSIFAAAWRWAWASPGGGAMLQLTLAGLVALFTAAVRFGPALAVVERRRRSPLEHLDALAVGLERAGGHETAVWLITQGLRRRLSRTGAPAGTRAKRLDEWLRSLALAGRSDEARAAVTRLAWLVRERGGTERVLLTAQSVEDVWEALRPNEPKRF